MFNVVVHFETTPTSQATALAEIGAYVEEFLSRQAGFVQSWLSGALDGSGIVHFALWQSEADFKAAGEKAREHPALPGLMQYQPRGKHYTVARTFSAD
jgi:hypothetical protein